MALTRPIQQARTLTPNNPPPNGTLLEGQLSVEFNPPRIWVGGPGGTTNVQLASPGIAEPGTAGNFLRTNVGTWVAGLPLTGGVMSGAIEMPAAFTPTGDQLATATWVSSQIGAAGGGTVTNIGIGTGLNSTQTPLTTTGTLSLANTAVTPGTYQGLTVDQQGRVTAAVDMFPIDSGTY